MSTPVIILVVLLAMDLGFVLSKHGDPRVGTYSFGWKLVSTVIFVWILYSGGFFSKVTS